MNKENIDYKKPTIIWQNWVDPLFNEDSEAILKTLATIQHNIDEEDIKIHTPIKMIPHPIYGSIPVTEHCQIGKMFKFWVGHTNFKLTQKIVSIVDSTLGVEALNILSPYRFRVAVGVAFRDRTVMRRIVRNIKSKNKHLDIIQSIIQEELDQNKEEEGGDEKVPV